MGEVVRDISGWLEEVGATRRVHFNSQGVNCQVCLESDKLMNKHVTSQPLTLNLCFFLLYCFFGIKIIWCKIEHWCFLVLYIIKRLLIINSEQYIWYLLHFFFKSA